MRAFPRFSMETLRIEMVHGGSFVSMSLAYMLRSYGHAVVAYAHTAEETVEKARKFSPDLIIMDSTMEGGDCLLLSRAVLEQHALPILLIVEAIDRQFIDQAEAAGISGYFIHPIELKDIEPALILARSRFRRLQVLQQEISDLNGMLQARKVIERAKGLLMERERISEEEAFRRIQGMSRDRNIPMASLSESIIMTCEFTQESGSRKKQARQRGDPGQGRTRD